MSLTATVRMATGRTMPLKARKAALTLTPSALNRLRSLYATQATSIPHQQQQQQQQQPASATQPPCLKIGVKTKGCSGLQYTLSFAEKKSMMDEEVVQDGIRVIIDSKALLSVLGSEMDYVEDKLSSHFVFTNPNVKEACGCGMSFMV
ncbi:hypothetical protein GQ42DRAFT_178299 [Ramicandelaber brevisporus]|nr:hypothetical protein GQ42DRAFT_178299 [Ramicandelaber brevisporus]